MSITTADDRITSYSPIVAQADFPADFPVFALADLGVWVDGVERFDFTTSGSFTDGISNNAKVTFSPGITGDVLVVGSRDPHRTNRFSTGAPLPISAQNLALDTLESEVQEAARDISRSIKAPPGSAGYSIASGITSGALLVMGDDGIEEGPSYAGIGDGVEDAQAAAAAAAGSALDAASSALAAAGSAMAAAGSADDAAASQGQAQNLVDAAQAAYVGFQPGTFYDLGRVTDSLELFPGDLGRVSDL